MNKKIFFIILACVACIAAFVLFGFKPYILKADNVDPYNNVVYRNTSIYFDYNYIKNFNDSYEPIEPFECDFYINDILYQGCTIYVNRQVFSSSYLEMYIYDDGAGINYPLSILKYSEPLGEYVFNIYDNNESVLRSIPLSSLTKNDLHYYYIKTIDMYCFDDTYSYLELTQYYNGWFSFDNVINMFPLPYSQEHDYYFDINGYTAFTLTYENDIYSRFKGIIISKSSNLSLDIYYRFYNASGTQDILVYSNDGTGWVEPNAKYIFISNSNFSITLFNYLTTSGLFDMTYQVPTSDMKDLIFAYADIPVKIIKDMTSFEILGFTLFAVLGTIILVILVIKLLKHV